MHDILQWIFTAMLYITIAVIVLTYIVGTLAAWFAALVSTKTSREDRVAFGITAWILAMIAIGLATTLN